MKTLIILVSLFSLQGCVAVWGSSYNIAMANSRSVVVEYDPAVINLASMLNAVQTECDKYNKDAVLDSTSKSNLGILVNTYRCETRNADQVIDIQN
ncbi:hypothetical protein GNP44_18885 [Aliivibrio fischeri]|uniref:hypothetical protein n=1 Tax=Aliivibrio fischeri TaxID=668 RepID=UPI0012D93DF4|nr:hypothetical protein [Aliivibrio fischeri]MUK32136.1 hypothetical protein [Aliivibrio fischeri]